MANTIKMQIQFRRDTTANWETYKDIIPAAGEPCFDIELGTLKIGNGTSTYGELEPIGGGVAVSADGKSIVLDDGVFKLVGFDAAEVGAQPRKGENGLEWVVPTGATVEELQTIVNDLQTDVTSLQEIVTPSAEDAVPLLTRVETLEEKMDGTGEGSVDAKIDAKINAFANQISDDGTVNTLKELVNYVANHGGEIATIVADITTLHSLVGDEKVSDQIATAVSGKVDAEEGKSLVADNLISKLEAIEEGAQVNKIDEVYVGETLLEIVDKKVVIPVGAGLKESEEIAIADDGVLTIKSISIDKVVQDEDSVLVMDGGGAV